MAYILYKLEEYASPWNWIKKIETKTKTHTQDKYENNNNNTTNNSNNIKQKSYCLHSNMHETYINKHGN